jgi:hypothetical protein
MSQSLETAGNIFIERRCPTQFSLLAGSSEQWLPVKPTIKIGSTNENAGKNADSIGNSSYAGPNIDTLPLNAAIKQRRRIYQPTVDRWVDSVRGRRVECPIFCASPGDHSD